MPAKITKLHDDKPAPDWPWPYADPDDPLRHEDEEEPHWQRSEPLSSTALGLLLLAVVLVSVPWLIGVYWLASKVMP
jgi:hypothetical protein